MTIQGSRKSYNDFKDIMRYVEKAMRDLDDKEVDLEVENDIQKTKRLKHSKKRIP